MNELYECAVLKLYMKKVGEFKEIVVPAGINRYISFYVAIADVCARSTPWDRNCVVWLVSILQGVESAGVKLGDLIRAFGCQRYAKYGVVVPEGACVASNRHGAGTTDVKAGLMRGTIADHTGHDHPLSNVNAYVKTDVADSVPLANVLLGWPGFAPGRNGPAARPPTLKSILSDGVDECKLNELLDKVLQISSESPFEVQRKGRLRQILEAGFAEQVMYYEARFHAGEMSVLLRIMRNAYSETFQSNPHAAHNTFQHWPVNLYSFAHALRALALSIY